LWGSVEGMLTSYSDADFVSSAYGRELASARARAVSVEATSDDPPERIAGWLATVSDVALRGLDHQLLVDLLAVEEDPRRWRDVANTVVGHADDLVRVGYFDQAWLLAEAVVDEAARHPDRLPHARVALEQFGRGSMMKHVSAHLRAAADEAYSRFKRLCHAVGTAIIMPLAEALSSEQDARARRRLRDILLEFGAQGRESVQQLMNAPNWEVRRTAAYLLREFGGTEGLKDLVPLLTDTEPLVRREAVQGLALNGTDDASGLLFRALTTSSGRARVMLTGDVMAMRDERAAPFLCFLLRHLNRRAWPQLHAATIETLGAMGAAGGPDAVDALKAELAQGDWWAPFRTRRLRGAIAAALRKIGTPPALDALRAAAAHGSRGVRVAAREELARHR
jgi:HEAT repeat protein